MQTCTRIYYTDLTTIYHCQYPISAGSRPVTVLIFSSSRSVCHWGGGYCVTYLIYLPPLSWVKMKCTKHKWFISDLAWADPVIQTGPAAPCHKRTTGEDPCQDVNQPEQVYNTDNLAPIVAPALIPISFDTPPLSLWQYSWAASNTPANINFSLL